jgi:hypothetical protein
VASHEGFTEKNGLTVPLLADVDGTVAKAYSAHGRLGTKRAVIVIDEDGVVRHRHDHLPGSTTSRWTSSRRRWMRCRAHQRARRPAERCYRCDWRFSFRLAEVRGAERNPHDLPRCRSKSRAA